MMRRGWLVALAVVVAVNLGVWVGVWRNRAGEPDATVALDEREIVLLGGADGSPTDGKLNNVESFTDSHVRVGSCDLPATRRIITYENGEVVVKNLTFTNHKLV